MVAEAARRMDETVTKHQLGATRWLRDATWQEALEMLVSHFGLGHGNGAHAPDEYYVIESANPTVQGMDGGVRSFVDLLYELAV